MTMPAPRTAFEQRGKVAPWTSRTEEDAFIEALDAYSPKLSTEIIGAGAGGSPLRLIKLGTGPRTILYVAQQHGEELSGREALLTRLRDWVDSTDPAMIEYLEAVTILAIPTAHPDNLTVRENPAGANVNREHLSLSAPESLAIQRVIRDYAPVFVGDLHEGRNFPNDFATSAVETPNADSEITRLSYTLEAQMREAIVGAGRSWQRYPSTGTSPVYLNNTGGLRGALSILTETRRADGVNTDLAFRQESQLLAIDALQSWLIANREMVNAVTDAAKTRMAARRTPHKLVIGSNASGPLLDPLPYAYRLTAEQLEKVSEHFGTFAITATPEGDGYVVSMAQAGQVLISYLLDPESGEHETSAARIMEPLGPEVPAIPPEPDVPYVDIGTPAGYSYRDGGTTRPVLALQVRLSGQTHTVWEQASAA